MVLNKDVFIIIVLITLVLVAYLTIHDWITTPRYTKNSIQKILRSASKSVLLRNWQAASEILFPLIEMGKGGKEAILLYTQVLRGTNQLDEALLLVKDASKEYPEELQFRMEEGFLLLEMGHPQEALEAFMVCAPIMRNESEILALAKALNQTGRSTQAFEFIEPWLKTTQNGEVLALAGDTLFERKQFKEAIDFYRRSIERGYQTHLVTTQLAHTYQRLGNLVQAEQIFRKLLEKDPTDLTATLGLGACSQERGHFQKALLIYQSSGAWEKKDCRLLKEAGICALKTKKYSFAERYFLEVIQKEQPNHSIYAYYALSLESQKKWQEAEQAYLRLIKLFPSYPQGYRALAWMFGVGLSCTLSPQEGISFAHVGLKLKSDPISWEILSACEARVGNFKRAYQIQASLAAQETSKEMKIRRQQALRSLRKQHPLDDHHVTRSLVA